MKYIQARSTNGSIALAGWAVASRCVIVLSSSICSGISAGTTPPQYSDIQEHFKYGSIGSEPGGSIFNPVGGVLPPYLVFKTLPQVCPDKLPGGYASLGLVFEPNHEMPIGVSRRWRLGTEQVGLNCAVCHTGTVREKPDSPPMIVLGMPAHQLDLEHLFQFIHVVQSG